MTKGESKEVWEFDGIEQMFVPRPLSHFPLISAPPPLLFDTDIKVCMQEVEDVDILLLHIPTKRKKWWIVGISALSELSSRLDLNGA